MTHLGTERNLFVEGPCRAMSEQKSIDYLEGVHELDEISILLGDGVEDSARRQIG